VAAVSNSETLCNVLVSIFRAEDGGSMCTKQCYKPEDQLRCVSVFPKFKKVISPRIFNIFELTGANNQGFVAYF
jgi:hypothetical protein